MPVGPSGPGGHTMQVHFANVWQSIADEVGDRDALIHGDEHVSWHSVLERGRHGGGVPEVGLVDPDVVLRGGPDGGAGTLRARLETLAPSLAANVARASPMPLDQPVMKMWRPLRGIRAERGHAKKVSAATVIKPGRT